MAPFLSLVVWKSNELRPVLGINRMLVVGVAVSLWVGATLFATVLVPTVAHATGVHGAGTCGHRHLEDVTANFCNGNVPGKNCKDDDGDAGNCKQVHSGGPNCACITINQERQEFQIRVMYDTTKTALQFPGVVSALGLTVACSQFSPLAANLLVAKSTLLALGALTFWDPELLGFLDFILLALPQMGSFAGSCSTTFPVSDATGVLLQLKAQMISAF